MCCDSVGDVGVFYLGGSLFTIDGEPQTVATCAKYLASVELKPRLYRRLARCKCSTGVCRNRPETEMPGGAWNLCPMYVNRSSWWRSIVAAWQQLEVCGSVNLDKAAAWLFFGVMTLQQRVNNGNRNK